MTTAQLAASIAAEFPDMGIAWAEAEAARLIALHGTADGHTSI